MAENYDGDIKLSVGLDVSKTKFSLKDLVSNIKKAFSSNDPQIRSMGLQMQKLKDNIDKTQKSLSDLKNTKAPTAEFKQLNKELDNTRNKLSTARSALKDMESSRVPTAEYQKLNKQLEDLMFKRKMALSNIDYYKNKGDLQGVQKSEAYYNQLESQIKSTTKAIVDLEEAGKQYADSPEIDKKREEVKGLEREVGNLEKQIKDLQNSGLDIDFNVKKIQATEQKLGYLKTQAEILNQKFREANTSQHQFSQGVKSLATKASGLFKTIGQAIKKHTIDKWKESTRSLRSNLRQVLRNIVGLQALIRVLRTVASYAKEAFKDMALQYPEINAQLSDLLSHFEQFKHSIATMLQPLLNIVLPILNTIIDAFITAANAVGSFFAALTGQGFIYKAIKQQKNFAGAVGGTGSAAKEAKEELAEYDKLIVISSDDAGSGGGGGGGAGGGSAFEQVAIESEFNGFVNRLKRMWQEADFTELGEELGQKIIDALNSIPWDKIKEVAYKLARSIATFLNGLISPELFESLGHTLAEALNTAFLFLKTFGDTFEWKEFGESIGRGITKFFRDADFAMWGDTVHTWIAGILDAGIALVDNTDWALLGTRIGEFIANLDIPDLVGKLAKLAFKIVSGLAEAILNIGSESPIAGAIIALITTIAVAGKLGKLATAISEALGTELTTTGITLGSALPVVLAAGLLIHVVKILWKYANGEYDSIQDLMYDLIFDKPINIKHDAGSIESGGNGLPKKPEKPDENGGMRNYYTDLYGLTTPELWDEYEKQLKEYEKDRAQKQEVFQKYTKMEEENKGMHNYYTDLYGLTHPENRQHNEEVDANKQKRQVMIQGNQAKNEQAAYELAKDIVRGGIYSFDGVSDLYFNKYGSLAEKALTPTFDFFKGIGSKFSNLFGGDTSGAEAAIYKKTGGIQAENTYKGLPSSANSNKVFTSKKGNTLESLPNQIKTAFEELPKELSKSSKQAYKAVTSPFKSSGDWAKNTAGNISKGFETLPNDVESDFKGAYTKSTDEFKGINQWAKNVERDTSKGFDNLPSNVEQRYRKANSQGRAQFDGSQSWASSIVSLIDNGFSGLPSQVQSRYKTAYDDGTSTFSQAGNWAKNKALEIGGGFNGLSSEVKTRFSLAYTAGTDEFKGSQSWAGTVVTAIGKGLVNLPSTIRAKFKSGFDGAGTEATTFNTWLSKQKFTTDFKINTPSQNSLQQIYNGLAGIWKDRDASFTVNANGGNFKSKVQSFVDAINIVVGQINSGLETLKKNRNISGVTTLPKVRMPADRYFFAKGAVIPPNKQFLGVLGDQSNGVNIETPLNTMIEAFNTALAQNGGTGAQTVNVVLDGRVVAQVMWDAQEKKYKQTGRS